MALVIRAIAIIERLPARGIWFRILACPAAPDHEGAVFVARQDDSWRVGQYVVVKFLPDDQCAYEWKEALQDPPAAESMESRVKRGLHPEPGPHCVECGIRLTEAEAAAQLPDHDEVCPPCGGPTPIES